MLQDERTLIVVADGGQVRFFEEHRRGGPLHERGDWTKDLTPPSASAGSPGRVFDRFGAGSHPLGRTSPKDHAEDVFLAAVAERMESLALKEAYDGLILIAAPRALGRLRASMSAAVLARVRHSEPKDRVKADAEALRVAVSAVRRRRA